MEIRNVALDVRFGDAADLTLAKVRNKMIFGNQRKAGMGLRRDHWLLLI